MRKIKFSASVIATVALLFFITNCNGGGNHIDRKLIIGKWKWDVKNLKTQMAKASKLKDTPESRHQMDSIFRPLEILVMEFKNDSVVIAHVDSATTINGVYGFSEDNKFMKTEIGNFPKLYQVKSLTREKIVLLETIAKTPIKEYILYPARE